MQAPHKQNMDLIPPVLFELNPRSRTALPSSTQTYDIIPLGLKFSNHKNNWTERQFPQQGPKLSLIIWFFRNFTARNVILSLIASHPLI